jgi:hypothetical protein
LTPSLHTRAGPKMVERSAGWFSNQANLWRSLSKEYGTKRPERAQSPPGSLGLAPLGARPSEWYPLSLASHSPLPPQKDALTLPSAFSQSLYHTVTKPNTTSTHYWISSYLCPQRQGLSLYCPLLCPQVLSRGLTHGRVSPGFRWQQG